MTGRRGYGCGGLFFQNEVSIPPLIQNDYLLLKKRIYETDKTGFLHGERGRNQNHDIYGVRPAYPAYGMRGKSGTVCRCEPADTGMLPAALCQKGTRELSPEELHKRIAEEMKTGCKYLLVYRSEEEMTAALDGRYTPSAIRTANSFATCISRIISIWKTGAILWTPHPFRTCISIPIGQSPTPRYATRCSPPGW